MTMRNRTKISVVFWSMVVALLMAAGPTFASGQQAIPQATEAATDADAGVTPEPAEPADGWQDAAL